MTLNQFVPDSFFNWNLAKSPLNWAMVWAIATFWLLVFHLVMTGWQRMGGNQPAFSAAPGQVAAPAILPDAASAFIVPGDRVAGTDLGMILGGGATAESWWGDDIVAKFAEDGWTGNS